MLPLGKKLVAWAQELGRKNLNGARLVTQIGTDSGADFLVALAELEPDKLPEIMSVLLATTLIMTGERHAIELRDEATIDRVFRGHDAAILKLLSVALAMLVNNDKVPLGLAALGNGKN